MLHRLKLNKRISYRKLPEMRNQRALHGFTLLEILVALLIFSIISVIMVNALHSAIDNQAAIDKRASRLADLQRALLLMSRDIEQSINRPIMVGTSNEGAFIGDPNAITFTHTGLANPFLANHSTLQRTKYSLEGGAFTRSTWTTLDRTDKSPVNTRPLMPSVSQLQFKYLDQSGKFSDTWPPKGAEQARTLAQSGSYLPFAVQVTLVFSDWGKLTQLYLIPGQPPIEQPT